MAHSSCTTNEFGHKPNVLGEDPNMVVVCIGESPIVSALGEGKASDQGFTEIRDPEARAKGVCKFQ